MSRITSQAVLNPPSASRPTRGGSPVATSAPPDDLFVAGAKSGPGADPGRLLSGFLAKPPTVSANVVAEALRGPNGFTLMGLIRQQVGSAPEALVPLMLGAPEKLTHLDTRALLAATRYNPQLEAPVLDLLSRLASSRGDQAGFAAHQLVERSAAFGDPRLTELVRLKSPAVVAALKSQLSSEHGAKAAQLLLEAGERLPRKAAERLGEALGGSFGPRATIETLVNQAAGGDRQALAALTIAAAQNPAARGALREVYDATPSFEVRAFLAPKIETWSDGITSQDLDRAMSGAKLGDPRAIGALARQIELSTAAQPERQRAAAQLLSELAQGGMQAARAALLSVRIDHSTSADVVRLMSAAVKTPAEARALLDRLEIPLRWGTSDVSRAATDAVQTLGTTLEPRHQDWLLEALRGQSVRAAVQTPPGEIAAASTVAAFIDSPGLRAKLLDGLGQHTALGIAQVFARLPALTDRDQAALGRYFNSSPGGVGQQAVGAVLLKHGALETLATPAFSTLSLDQQQRVVDLCLQRNDEGLKARLLEQLPDSGVTGRLEALGGEYSAALVSAVKAAPEGSDLWKLGQYMAALKLADQPEYRGRIAVDTVKTKISQLTSGPLAGTLDALRSKVTAPRSWLVDTQAKYLSSPQFEMRARLLPEPQRVAFLKSNLSALSTLAPQKSQALAAERFVRLPAHAQESLLDALRQCRQLDGDGDNASLREQIAQVAKLGTEPGSKLAEGAARMAQTESRLATVLNRVNVGLSLLAVDFDDAWSLADAGKELGGLALAASEGAAVAAGRAALGKTLGIAGGALNLYDTVKAGFQAAEELRNGDNVGAAARIGSGAASLGMATGIALAASNPVGWTVLGVSAAVWLGSEVVDHFFGETDTQTRLRQLGVLVPS